MNILVTGGAGFFGTHLSRQLEHAGHCVVRLSHDRPRPSGCFVYGDVTDYDRMIELIENFEIEQVYHLAARSIVRNCNSDPCGCFRVNTLGTVTILEAARQSGRVKGVVACESDKAYGVGVTPYRENQMLRPQGIYEASKSCVSQIIPAFYYTYGLPVFGIRCANLFGPEDHHQTRIVPNTINRLLKGEKPVIVEGAEKFLREFVYVDDAVQCAVELMKAQPWGESVNVGSGETIRVRQLISLICELMGKPDDVEIAPRQSSFVEIPEQSLDLSRLRELWCDHKPVSLREGLERTIQWTSSGS